MVVWIMSQNILVHIHGERFARAVEQCLTLTGIPLCASAETAEARAQRWYIFGPSDRGMMQNVRPRKDEENGGLNLDVQVQIEQAVMVDYESGAYRPPRVFGWDKKKRSEIRSGDTSSADQGQWELSNVAKMTDNT
jgi:hypothetical protein